MYRSFLLMVQMKGGTYEFRGKSNDTRCTETAGGAD